MKKINMVIAMCMVFLLLFDTISWTPTENDSLGSTCTFSTGKNVRNRRKILIYNYKIYLPRKTIDHLNKFWPSFWYLKGYLFYEREKLFRGVVRLFWRYFAAYLELDGKNNILLWNTYLLQIYFFQLFIS